MIKYPLIALLILTIHLLPGQQILKCNEVLIDIDLVCEYFSNLDSAFAAKNRVAEINVIESFYNQGALVCERTKLNYRYDSLFKKSYSEVNSWAEDGTLIRSDIVAYYEDSLINTQIMRASYAPNPDHLFNTYVTKLVWLNDTLIKKDSYSYLDDSLYRHDDGGIEDTRAAYRENNRLGKSPVESVIIEMPARDDIGFHLEPEYALAQPHEDIILKDSLGRIVEMEQFFVTTIGDRRGSFPGKKYFIEYLDSTNIIQRIRAFDDFNSNKEYFENPVKDGSANGWNHFWPPGYTHNNLFFEYSASHFKVGIPQLVTISMGKEAGTQRVYETTIATR